MKRLHVMSLVFNSLPMAIRAIEQFETQKPDYPIASKTLVDCRYPLSGDPVEHAHRLHDLAWRAGWNFVRPAQNLGVAKNWQWVMDELDLKENDVLYGADVDGNPQQAKYLDAMAAVFNAAPECYTVQFNQAGVYALGIPHTVRTIGGVEILDYHQLTSWSLGAFDCGWVRRVGGMQQPHPQYGFIEHRMEELCKPLGGRWYILKDFYDEHLKSEDPAYTEWKLQCSKFATQLPFDKWLEFYGQK